MGEVDRRGRPHLTLVRSAATRKAVGGTREVVRSPVALAPSVYWPRGEDIIGTDARAVANDAEPCLAALVEIELESRTGPAAAGLLERLAVSPYVQAVLEVAGSDDLTVLVAANGMDDYRDFAATLLVDDPVVRHFDARFVQKRRTFSSAAPLE